MDFLDSAEPQGSITNPILIESNEAKLVIHYQAKDIHQPHPSSRDNRDDLGLIQWDSSTESGRDCRNKYRIAGNVTLGPRRGANVVCIGAKKDGESDIDIKSISESQLLSQI